MKIHPVSQMTLKNSMNAIGRMLGWVQNKDYRLLNEHLLAMQEKEDLDGLLAEVSHCLSEMLNYRLFAFVIRDETGVDVWIDPTMFRDAFSRIVSDDLGLEDGVDIRFMGNIEETVEQRLISREDLEVRSFKESSFTAHLYLATGRRMLAHHNDILESLLAGLRVSLINHVRIRSLQGAVSEDALTGCYNRREFDRQLERHLAAVKRHGKDFALVFFDLDHFKAVNDSYGHLAGDAVLRSVALEVRRKIRAGDLLCRYGGEEFALLLPETNGEKAADLAERLRLAIEGLRVEAGEALGLQVTASFGVAEADASMDSQDMVAQADAMLYRAKNQGRNGVAF
ncbi:diguanylate cyclase (GGDEF)-like protein [Desulfobotulus alkaliphilus]|uniref:diguanylate cyclase n=1 Tax=Desulfobotulus alkaliphilus TaxID=622671 RepID=A0A562R4F0_9BACT|nr:GGDEF domain-containing protein [Desulfobotulus alkaliphilus]TWI63927.1 diguanylate cyclase (GGDEF)-like protein [Desulfobotulus alkaliphilus]